MERRVDRPPPSRRPRDQRRASATPAPSSSTFSSSLLDSIYRSMGDDPDSFVHPKSTITSKDRYVISRPPRHRETNAAALSRHFNEQPRSECPRAAAARVKEKPSHRWLIPSSSSSSDGSSCTGFSSDDTSRLPSRLKLKPVRTSSTNQRNRTDEKKIKKQPPASPGARLASFISSFFSAAARGGQKKHRSAATVAAAAENCSSASSLARSCMNRSTAAEEKKRVKFKAASGDQEFRRVEFYCGRRTAAVEELIKMRSSSDRGFVEVEEDEGSDASSDLFELEILTVGRYTDELPVYGGTTIAKF